MFSVDDLKAVFDGEYLELWRLAEGHFAHLDEEAREVAVSDAMGHAWRGIRQWHEVEPCHAGDARVRIRHCLWYSIKQVRGERRFHGTTRETRGTGRLDAYDLPHRPSTVGGLDVRIFFSRETSIPDRVAVSIDFPAFLATLDARDRAMIADMISGSTTNEIAEKYGITAGRVSQCRRKFAAMVREFFHE